MHGRLCAQSLDAKRSGAGALRSAGRDRRAPGGARAESAGGAALRRELEVYIRGWFDLDRDLRSFQKLARKDPVLRGLAKSYYGYRIVAIPDLFECLVWAVIGQQINLAFAYRLKRSFVEAYGESLEFDGEFYYAFPKASVVARARPERLRRMQFSRQKIEYTRIIARAVASGEINQAELTTLPFDAVHRALTRIKGVGNWTANYALMRCLLRPEAFPREDVGIHNALRLQMGLDRKPTLAEVDEVFKRYRGHEAYASAYLWMSLLADSQNNSCI
ncbi:MAG: DNA-3-methyladenine glycosylase [bacterium]|nr:DNA-3-methyladenine glycosylase [bacterium]